MIAIKFLVAWVLFILGDIASRIMTLFDSIYFWAFTWYRIYNFLMVTSQKVQGDGPGPWGKLEE